MDQNQLNLAAEHAREVITEIDGNIAIITMNRPEKLNGWTMEMMEAFKAAFVASDARDDVKAIIFTGTGKYFSAGANLSGVFRPMAPRALFDMIVDHNQALFDIFIDCKTPVLVAINGHAIGATVTSAALCDGVIAVDDATFSTPFKALGITPEGCSTEVFPALMGKDNADRMLGAEGWKPTAAEAVDAGLVDQAVPSGELMTAAKKIAADWVATGKKRQYPAGFDLDRLREINRQESEILAGAFLGSAFLDGQAKFLRSKGKYGPSLMFSVISALRPVWRLFL